MRYPILLIFVSLALSFVSADAGKVVRIIDVTPASNQVWPKPARNTDSQP